MKLKIIVLVNFFIISCSLNLSANGLGPFEIPPLGNNENFREIPAFISPADHKEKKMKINFSTRYLNIWTYNVESDKEYTNEDEELEYGSFFLDMESYSINPRFSFKASENIRLEAITYDSSNRWHFRRRHRKVSCHTFIRPAPPNRLGKK